MAIYFNGVDVTSTESSGTKFATTIISKRLGVGGSDLEEFTLDININIPRGFSTPFVTFFLTVDLFELPEGYLQSVWATAFDGMEFGSSNVTSQKTYSITGMLGKNNGNYLTVHVKLYNPYLISVTNALVKGYIQFWE